MFSTLHILLSFQGAVCIPALVLILHHGDHTFQLILRELSHPVSELHVCHPHHRTRVSSPYFPPCSASKGSFPSPVNMGVEFSKNVLELLRSH